MKEKYLNGQEKKLEVDLPEDWQKAINLLTSQKKFTVLVAGKIDSGKSTFSNTLLHRTQNRVYLLEADPGQPTHTLPGTFALVDKTGTVFYRYYVGDVAPQRVMAEVILGVYLLAKRTSGASLIIDTSGYVSDDNAIKLKVAKAKLTKSEFAVLIEKEEGELEKLAYYLSQNGITVLKCKSSAKARRYSLDERRKRREEILRSYFKNGVVQEVNVCPLKVISFLKEGDNYVNQVCSFDDGKGMSLEMGLIKSWEKNDPGFSAKILVKKPVGKFSSLKIGRIYLKETF